MNYLPFTLLAYLLNSVAVTVDKFLLVKKIPNPLLYIFYFSAVSLLALLVLPLTKIPPLPTLGLASTSTLLWTLGAYFMFKALQIGKVSRVIPVIGTLIPLALLINALWTNAVSIDQTWAVIFLIFGLIFLTLPDWRGKIKLSEAIFEILSAGLFAISYILLRAAYLQWDFLSVLVWSRLVLIPVGLTLLALPQTRNIIFKSSGPRFNFKSRAGLLFFFGQVCGGTSELLLTFSVALANPAVVNSLQGIQYVLLFIFSLILSKKFPEVFQERIAKLEILDKIAGILLIFVGLYILAFSQMKTPPTTFGLTYSPRYAAELGLDPRVTYHQILDDLRVKQIRLPVYWDEVEIFPNRFNFTSVDYYLNEAQQKNVKVILTLGIKQPRWPECFAPEWIQKLTRQDRDQKTVELVKTEVEHFKKYPNIIAWQVENEPFFNFGVCTPPNWKTHERVKQEVAQVKSIDSRPVIVTDSGELGFWLPAYKLADSFGITLYRFAWNPYMGSVDFPLPPFYYRAKAGLVKLIGGGQKGIFISELQAEPWVPNGEGIKDVKASALFKLFSPDRLQSHVKFSQETGLPHANLWGVEYWYYMSKNGFPQYLEFVKKLF